jgi:2-dehydro-3-deoxy-D-arabinonate dehydratase
MMLLTRHQTSHGPRWAANHQFLADNFDLRMLLAMPRTDLQPFIDHTLTAEPASGPLLAPIEMTQEVWGCGVTYERSRVARRAESSMGDIYDRVYAARRPELFFKTIGWRAVGHQQTIRIRADSVWNVPEPELTLVVNQHQEIVGYTVGNDVSARSIEGENPLYLPQAKIYDASCALGPGLQLLDDVDTLRDLPIALEIVRASRSVFHGETRTSRIARRFEDLIAYLFRELSFPHGVLLMTGTGIVPPDDFTLTVGDTVTIVIGALTLENTVQ